MTLTFDPLILKVRGTSKSVQTFSEIEQFSAELLIILRIFAHVMSHLTSNFKGISGVIPVNYIQNLSEIK